MGAMEFSTRTFYVKFVRSVAMLFLVCVVLVMRSHRFDFRMQFSLTSLKLIACGRHGCPVLSCKMGGRLLLQGK